MSDDLGAGACGLGSSGFGFGDPAQTTSSTASLLLQPDGTQGDCARFDAVSGDYLLDATGNKVGWDSVSQRVFLALRTTLGSAAVTTLGIALPTGVITDNIQTRIELAVAAALKSLVDAQLVELVDVIVTRSGTSALRTEVQWRRLSNGALESTFI